jgi:4-carboxymuconolactone decarboxylase
MTRYPLIPPEDMYFEQRRVAEAVGKRRKKSASSGGGVEGPFIPLLHVPGILDRLQMLGEYCRFYTDIPPKLRELAIMITARHVAAQIEFHVHAIEAREFGFAEEGITDIAANRRPSKLDDDEALVYDFCTELHRTGRVSDEVFSRAEKRFGKAVILELIATCGYYATLGLVLNVTQAPVPEFLGEVVMPFPVAAD